MPDPPEPDALRGDVLTAAAGPVTPAMAGVVRLGPLWDACAVVAGGREVVSGTGPAFVSLVRGVLVGLVRGGLLAPDGDALRLTPLGLEEAARAAARRGKK